MSWAKHYMPLKGVSSRLLINNDNNDDNNNNKVTALASKVELLLLPCVKVNLKASRV